MGCRAPAGSTHVPLRSRWAQSAGAGDTLAGSEVRASGELSVQTGASWALTCLPPVVTMIPTTAATATILTTPSVVILQINLLL